MTYNTKPESRNWVLTVVIWAGLLGLIGLSFIYNTGV